MTRAEVSELIARQIRRVRQTCPGVTASRAAAFLGISVEEFERIESGAALATGEQVTLLAELMDVEPSRFLEGLRHKTPPDYNKRRPDSV